MPVAIWRPIVIRGNHGPARLPDPAKVVRVEPIAIGIEFLRAPDVLVVILNIPSETLCEMALALFYPIVDGIRHVSGEQFPIPGILSVSDEYCRTTVTQRETRSV